MKVLITGATGFIGSCLSRTLTEKGHEVFAIFREDNFNYVEHTPDITWMKCDLVDSQTLDKIVKMSSPDVVIHTAAITPVRNSFYGESPRIYGEVNYLGTTNLVNASLKEGIKQFIHASTAEVYHSKDRLLSEDDSIGGDTPYGVSKSAADSYVQMAGKVWNLPFTILRPANTFGRPFHLPEEARGYLTEKAIIGMLTKNSVHLDGSPNRVRCFLHLDDHISAYLTVFNSEKCLGQIYNVSTSREYTIGEWINWIVEQTGFESAIHWEQNPRPYDPISLCPDGSKLMELGWKAKYHPSHEGLKPVVEYWRKVLGK